MAHYYFLRSYWFTENEIVSVGVISPAYFFVLFVAMLSTFLLATGTLGGFIEGLVAGVLSWLILTLVSFRIRGRLTKLTINELAVRKGTIRIPLSKVSWIRLRGRRINIFVGGKVQKARIIPSHREAFLALIASKGVAMAPAGTPAREEAERPMIQKAMMFLLLGFAGLGGTLWLLSNYYLFQIPSTASSSFATSQVGMLMFLDAPNVYSIWKPPSLSPILRWVASVGLVIFTLSTAVSIADGGPSALILPIQSVGLFLSAFVAGIVLAQLVKSRFHDKDPSEL